MVHILDDRPNRPHRSQLHHPLPTSGGGGATPTLEQVLTAGNTADSIAIVGLDSLHAAGTNLTILSGASLELDLLGNLVPYGIQTTPWINATDQTLSGCISATIDSDQPISGSQTAIALNDNATAGCFVQFSIQDNPTFSFGNAGNVFSLYSQADGFSAWEYDNTSQTTTIQDNLQVANVLNATIISGAQNTLDDGSGNVTILGTITAQGLPVGTIASPPAGLTVGQMWLDTTTSSANPIVRLNLS